MDLAAANHVPNLMRFSRASLEARKRSRTSRRVASEDVNFRVGSCLRCCAWFKCRRQCSAVYSSPILPIHLVKTPGQGRGIAAKLHRICPLGLVPDHAH
jgi:hypothetical protein